MWILLTVHVFIAHFQKLMIVYLPWYFRCREVICKQHWTASISERNCSGLRPGLAWEGGDDGGQTKEEERNQEHPLTK